MFAILSCSLLAAVRGAVPMALPQWPGQVVPQQFHLDFGVDDLDQAEAMLLELGAAKPAFQPGGGQWRVFVDPAGHPFCLAIRRS